MTKMASRPIYCIKPSRISFFGTKRVMTLKLGIGHRVLKYYQICSNDDTGLTLTIFMTWSNLFRNASAWVKAYTANSHVFPILIRGARWLSGRVSDSGARGPGFETYRRCVVSLSKTLYSPKVLVNYPGSDGSVPTWLKNCWLGR